jgi:hypothetical protein
LRSGKAFVKVRRLVMDVHNVAEATEQLEKAEDNFLA